VPSPSKLPSPMLLLLLLLLLLLRLIPPPPHAETTTGAANARLPILQCVGSMQVLRRRAPGKHKGRAHACIHARQGERKGRDRDNTHVIARRARHHVCRGPQRTFLARTGAETAFAVAFRPKSSSVGKTPFGKKVALWAENGGLRPRRGRRRRGGHGGRPRAKLKIPNGQLCRDGRWERGRALRSPIGQHSQD
jgi:hypothetical protein